MPGFHVSSLKGKVESYARPYLFNIYLDSAPVALAGGENQAAYLVRSGSLPTGTIEPIEVPWQGQTYKIGGTHTFDTWSCTFNVDMAANIRRQFVLWQEAIHNPNSNIQGLPSAYQGSVRIELLSVNAVPVMTYILNQAWPSEVGEISLDYSENSDVAQFDVTFTYNWHTVV